MRVLRKSRGLTTFACVNDVNVVYLVLKACVVRYCVRLFCAEVLHMFYSVRRESADNVCKLVCYSDIRVRRCILILKMIQEKAGTPFCVCAEAI